MEDLREMGIPCYRFLIYIDPQDGQESFNSNHFLKLVLSHISQIAGSCSVPESWSGSTLAAFTGFRLDQRHHNIHYANLTPLVLVVGFKDVIVNAAYDKELLRQTAGATMLLGTRDP